MAERVYKAAKYIRLSYTDDKENESDSVQNQRRLIDSFIAGHPDIEVVSERVDDGVSGVIFDRPAFKAMMADIEAGKINCVIVKDLSRLGREYIETGRYLRRIFPAYGVRFIAIGDNIDTLKGDSDDLVVSVKTLVNDAYSRDISVKTRSALHVKRAGGAYVGACPIYGYRKAESDKNLLVIDEYPASIVRDIFRMKIEGAAAVRIADTLNSLGVLSPCMYKKDRGLPHAKNGYADKADAKWSATAIIRVLTNETYTGTLIQGRQSTLNYKIKDIINKPESEWARAENAHEAIVGKLDFDLVQKLMRLDTRTAPGREKVHLFSGMLVCGCCGARMTRKINTAGGKKYCYYYCPTTKKQGCPSAQMIKEDDLVRSVLESVKAHIINVASLDALLASGDGRRMAEALKARYAAQIEESEQRLRQVRGFKASLYENMMGGLLSKEDYRALKLKYTGDESMFAAAIETLRQELGDVLAGKGERLRWTENFKRFENITELDRRAVASLIHSIKVVSKRELQITFNYHSEYEQAAALVSETGEALEVA
ncbi:MAG: recombinase family protein [Gracilibacteraceae bacterium]|nr:recombinase family protein [Gracilibacteraceae bacterium]